MTLFGMLSSGLRILKVAVAGIMLVTLVACSIERPAPPPMVYQQAQAEQQQQPRRQQQLQAGPQPIEQAYRLGPGDQTRLIVFGEKNLSGEFVVDGQGTLSLPLIGQIQVNGMTIRQTEQLIARELSKGYLNDPRVNVEVLNYRPFFILGEVKQGGQFNFQTSMTVRSAIALAGGYTYRADQSRVFIAHKGSNQEREYPINQDLVVQPGDVIRVPERFF